jgi:hypothetical protein
MDAIQALLNSVRDAVSDDPKPDWRQSLLDGFDAVEAERSDLMAALERIAWTECGAFSVQIARNAIVKAKGGE